MHRIAMIIAVAALFCLIFPATLWAVEGAGGGEGGEEKLPEGLKPADKPPVKTDGERRAELKARKDRFFKMFKGRLEDMEKNQSVPEKEEIARLTDLKGDYKSKLGKSEGDLERHKKIAKKSFMGLLKSDQPKTTIEQRCESIWLDYMADSRKSKMQINEYQRAISGIEKRVKYIRHRLATREYPTADKGQKYYLADPIEVYADEVDVLDPEMGGQKSQVSYYALLKDFVLGIMGKGTPRISIIAGKMTEPPLVEEYRQWEKRASLNRPKTAKEGK